MTETQLLVDLDTHNNERTLYDVLVSELQAANQIISEPAIEWSKLKD